MSKKIVFVEPGGLCRIMGDSSGFADDRLPVTAEAFRAGDRVVDFASLYRVTTRGAFYREPIIPASYEFNEAQR